MYCKSNDGYIEQGRLGTYFLPSSVKLMELDAEYVPKSVIRLSTHTASKNAF